MRVFAFIVDDRAIPTSTEYEACLTRFRLPKSGLVGTVPMIEVLPTPVFGLRHPTIDLFWPRSPKSISPRPSYGVGLAMQEFRSLGEIKRRSLSRCAGLD